MFLVQMLVIDLEQMLPLVIHMPLSVRGLKIMLMVVVQEQHIFLTLQLVRYYIL